MAESNSADAGASAEVTKAVQAREQKFGEIGGLLAAMDGVSLTDAMMLGRLIHEYGNACASIAGLELMLAFIRPVDKALQSAIERSKPQPREPWMPSAEDANTAGGQ